MQGYRRHAQGKGQLAAKADVMGKSYLIRTSRIHKPKLGTIQTGKCLILLSFLKTLHGARCTALTAPDEPFYGFHQAF
jgi:hypothetical protein